MKTNLIIILVTFFTISSFTTVSAWDAGYPNNGKFSITLWVRGVEVEAPNGADTLSLYSFYKENKQNSLCVSKKTASLFSQDTIIPGTRKYVTVIQVNDVKSRKYKKPIKRSDLEEYLKENKAEVPSLEWVTLAINQGFKIRDDYPSAYLFLENGKRNIKGGRMTPAILGNKIVWNNIPLNYGEWSNALSNDVLADGMWILIMYNVPTDKQDKIEIEENLVTK